MYNDRMEKAFVVDMVQNAVSQIERLGEAAFPQLHDRTGPFMAKDAYVFVVDSSGVELVNPAFRNLEGRNLIDVKDTQGKQLVREMSEWCKHGRLQWVHVAQARRERIHTEVTYVTKARMGDAWVLVGAGMYLADAPRATLTSSTVAAPQLMSLVREAAALLEQRGEASYSEFRQKGSKWFRDDTYLIAWTMEGTRTLHAANPALEGTEAADTKDVLGRPYGRMYLDVARSPAGEGWVHYMYPEPGDIFPAWKSTFVKRVTFPSGKAHLIAAGVYNMQMNKAFIEDVVDRAAALVAERGEKVFDVLRDKTGPFVFMDTYVFVDTPDGVELVNPAQPSLEGKSLMGQQDVNGKFMARDYIAAALKDGAAWVEYYWYKPGRNTPSRKQTYVRKVQSGEDIFIVGSGVYLEE
jgi:signal transduction histidine kinase